MRDIIRFSPEDFVCSSCSSFFKKDSLVNEFEYNGKTDKYCMDCLGKMDIDQRIYWDKRANIGENKSNETSVVY